MANTSNTFRDDPLRSEHRADEIGVHPRHTGGQWPGWLLPLLAVLSLLALAYWALSRRHRVEPTAPSITPQGEQFRNQIPEPPRQPGAPQAAPPPPPAAAPPPQATQEEKKAEPEAGKPEEGKPEAKQEAKPAPQAAGKKDEAKPSRQAGAACGATFAFPVDEQAFTDSQNAKLDQLASCLKANPATVIELEGRAHPVAGTPDDRTDALALRRAQMVETELERRGVQASQIRATRGEPFCTDSSADCLAKNRSVVATPAPQ